MTQDDGLQPSLTEKIERLSPPEHQVVEEFVDALLVPVEVERASDTWLSDETWRVAFLARLRAHHALNREPLGTLAFESAFNAACAAAGWDVAPATVATHRFFDTVVTVSRQPPRRISLKASAAKSIRRDWIHISKLTEAAWIQDARTQTGRHEKLLELFSDYRDATDSIMMLRCFSPSSSPSYELVEIPTTLFADVGNLSIGEAQLATIPIPPNADPPIFQIRVDRSDAKITLTRITISACTIHGRWTFSDPALTSDPEPAP